MTPIIEKLNNIKTGNHTDNVSGNFPFSPRRFEKFPKSSWVEVGKLFNQIS